MTLVLAVTGPESNWLLTDRQLSIGGRSVKSDARKVMILGGTDGTAVLGYAGLGATAHGTEPADWMSAVLRGRRGLTLEQLLLVLAGAMKEQMPEHLLRLESRAPAHHVIAPAFVGNETRLYTIRLEFKADRKTYSLRTNIELARGGKKPPRICVGGTGGMYLWRKKDNSWMRELLRVVRYHDEGKISSDAVGDHFAKLNWQVSRKLPGSVGPNCILIWRYRNGGVHHNKRNPGHQAYKGLQRDGGPFLPDIQNGTDVSALGQITAAVMWPALNKALETGEPPIIDSEAINELLKTLPTKPDQKLR